MLELMKIASSTIKSLRRLIKGDVFQDDTVEYEQATIPNIDSSPVGGEEALLIKISDTSDFVIFGVLENNPKVGPGEIKIFSRSGGEIKSYIYCKSDGNIQINDNVTIDPTGKTSIINNVEITGDIILTGNMTATGNVSAVGNVTAAAVSAGTLAASGGMSAGSISSSGSISTSGAISGGSVSAGSIDLATHTHPVPGITPGSGSTTTSTPT
jgi:hypothetical protein